MPTFDLIRQTLRRKYLDQYACMDCLLLFEDAALSRVACPNCASEYGDGPIVRSSSTAFFYAYERKQKETGQIPFKDKLVFSHWRPSSGTAPTPSLLASST